ELVSVADDQLLIAFRNEIHRETTEKPANREMIEQVVLEVIGKPLRMVTVMLKDWQVAMEGSSNIEAESLELEHEDIAIDEQEKQPNWIEEAVKLFGDELVVVTDEKD